MQDSIVLYPDVDDIGRVEYIDHMGDDKRIVDAARVSFAKDRVRVPFDLAKDPKLIRYMMANKHTTPFEHCTITWKFTVPLFVRGQHHRHRTWAYNEISRRYTSEALQFYIPKTFRSQHAKNKQASNTDEINPKLELNVDVIGEEEPASVWLADHVGQSLALFNSMLDAGIAREMARMVLPQNMYTEYYGTVNLHNAYKFLILRLDSHAQFEIRRPAQAMLEHLTELFPVATQAFKDLGLYPDK